MPNDAETSIVETPTSYSSALKRRRQEIPLSRFRSAPRGVQWELDQYTAEQEVDNASEMDRPAVDFLAYWRGKKDMWPNLANLARVVVTIPPSSAGAERVFSIAGCIVNPRRSKLSPGRVCQSVMTKVNSEL